MGEATYYARVEFETLTQAREALPLIRKFLKRMASAESYFQSHRGLKLGSKKKLSNDKLQALLRRQDAKLREKFPDVFEALNLQPPADGSYGWHSLNYLAGELDSPLSKWSDGRIYRKKNVVHFNGMVWHFANWRPLMVVMREVFGAKKAGYTSDEYINMAEVARRILDEDSEMEGD